MRDTAGSIKRCNVAGIFDIRIKSDSDVEAMPSFEGESSATSGENIIKWTKTTQEISGLTGIMDATEYRDFDAFTSGSVDKYPCFIQYADNQIDECQGRVIITSGRTNQDNQFEFTIVPRNSWSAS